MPRKVRDYTGETINGLHVTKAADANLYECECLTCGQVKSYSASTISKGAISCHCGQIGGGCRDYTDLIVGHLLVTRPVGLNDRGLVVWECVCQYKGCGTIKHYSSETLRKGTISCGCYSREQTRLRALNKYKDKQ